MCAPSCNQSLTKPIHLFLKWVMATRKDRRRDRTPLEESYEERSGVPFLGDTLPWNLSKHQRVKRSKSATAEVLDPADRAVIRIAGRGTKQSYIYARERVLTYLKQTFKTNLNLVFQLLQTY